MQTKVCWVRLQINYENFDIIHLVIIRERKENVDSKTFYNH